MIFRQIKQDTDINYLDLFSGIGGFHLGLTQGGFRFDWVGFSEIDRWAKQIYQKHFPEAEDLGDVRTIKPDALPKIDLLTFGFPCQDLSLAGKQKGLHSERSGLFFEAMRIVRATTPNIFIFENVPGLFSSNSGQDFATVLREVADIGLYECEWQVVDTAWFLPQRRKRIYFIGHLRGKSRSKVFPIGKSNPISSKTLQEPNNCFGPLTGTDYRGISKQRPNMIIDAYNAKEVAIPTAVRPNMRNAGPLIQLGVVGRGGQGQRIYSPEGNACLLTAQGGGQGVKTGLYAVSQGCGIRRLSPLECERLQGFPDEWTGGVSDTQRYKCLGNAVTVAVVKAIVELLLVAEERKCLAT